MVMLSLMDEAVGGRVEVKRHVAIPWGLIGPPGGHKNPALSGVQNRDMDGSIRAELAQDLFKNRIG